MGDDYGLLSRWQRAILRWLRRPPAAKYESLAKENTRTLLFQGWIDDKSQHIRKEEVKSVFLSERRCPTDVRWHLLKMSQGNVAIGLRTSNLEIPIWNSSKLWSQRLVRVWASFSDRSVVGSLQWQANKLAYSVLSCNNTQYDTLRTK